MFMSKAPKGLAYRTRPDHRNLQPTFRPFHRRTPACNRMHTPLGPSTGVLQPATECIHPQALPQAYFSLQQHACTLRPFQRQPATECIHPQALPKAYHNLLQNVYSLTPIHTRIPAYNSVHTLLDPYTGLLQLAPACMSTSRHSGNSVTWTYINSITIINSITPRCNYSV